MPADTNPPVDIPVPGEPSQEEGEDEMGATPTAEFGSLHDQNMAAMGQSMAQFQGNAVMISKAADFSYLQGKDLVSLTEAMGTREVSSRVNPSGPVPATAKE